jgi:hypothetical protein
MLHTIYENLMTPGMWAMLQFVLGVLIAAVALMICLTMVFLLGGAVHAVLEIGGAATKTIVEIIRGR